MLVYQRVYQAFLWTIFQENGFWTRITICERFLDGFRRWLAGSALRRLSAKVEAKVVTPRVRKTADQFWFDSNFHRKKQPFCCVLLMFRRPFFKRLGGQVCWDPKRRSTTVVPVSSSLSWFVLGALVEVQGGACGRRRTIGWMDGL